MNAVSAIPATYDYRLVGLSIVLAVMVLPTVTSIAVDAFQAVPKSFPEGSIALGATRWQTTRMVMFPAARSGKCRQYRYDPTFLCHHRQQHTVSGRKLRGIRISAVRELHRSAGEPGRYGLDRCD